MQASRHGVRFINSPRTSLGIGVVVSAGCGAHVGLTAQPYKCVYDFVSLRCFLQPQLPACVFLCTVVRFCLMRSQVPCGTCVFLTVPPARLFVASRSSIGGRLLFTPKRGRAFGRSPASGFSLLSSQFPQLKPGAVLLAPLQVHLPAPTGAGGRQIPCPRALPGPRMATSSTSWAAPAVTRTRCRARPGPWLPPTLVPVPQRGLLPPSV